MRQLRGTALVVASMWLVTSARAADNDPTGTWNWTTARGVATVKLKGEGDKVTGVMVRKNGELLKVEDGTFKDGEIAFTVPGKTPGGQPMVHKYHGKLAGDTIKGTATIELPDKTVSGDWEAKRVKD
jgi:hypothetical protein